MISVIVPVYNVEKYVRKCLDSVINQTYRDLEIIVVDDGSTDRSGRICDEYKSDNRVKVFHTENQGLSAARNRGLDEARGEWIGFVDSDDWIEPDMYECLIARALETGADVVECGYYKDYSDRAIKIVHPSSAKRTGEEAVRAILKGQLSTGVWNKLWKMTCFENLRYTVGRVFEDVAITYRLFLNSSFVCYIDEPKYHWLQREGSLSKSHDYLSLMGFWLSHKERYEILKECMGVEVAREQLKFCASAASRVWVHFYDWSTEEREINNEFVREINKFSKMFLPPLGYKEWGVALRIGTFLTHFCNPLVFRIAWFMNKAFPVIVNDINKFTLK